MSGVGDFIKQQGWGQGKILKAQDVRALLPEQFGQDPQDEPVGIVASHSCDLAHLNEDNEPFADVILGRKTEISASGGKRGNFTHGKNPRRLCLAVSSHPHGKDWYEFRPFDLHRIKRAELAAITPDEDRFLLPGDIGTLSVWLAERYRRSALPDSFNELLRKESGKLNKIYKRINPHCSAVYVELDPDGEISSGETYAVNLLLTVLEAHADKIPVVREDAERLAALMQELGMDARAAVQAESEVSVAVVRRVKKLPLEHLSLRGEGQPMDPLADEG